MESLWYSFFLNTFLVLNMLIAIVCVPYALILIVLMSFVYIMRFEWPTFHRGYTSSFLYPILPFFLLCIWAHGGIRFFIAFMIPAAVSDATVALVDSAIDSWSPRLTQQLRTQVSYIVRSSALIASVWFLWDNYEHLLVPFFFSSSCIALVAGACMGNWLLEQYKRQAHTKSTGHFLGSSSGLLDRWNTLLCASCSCLLTQILILSLYGLLDIYATYSRSSISSDKTLLTVTKA